MSEQPVSERPSLTSIMVAAGRAIGAREPDPSVRNPDWLAERLLGPEVRALPADHPVVHALDRDYSEAIQDLEVLGSVRMMTIRTRFIDDRLEHAVRNGARQVVMLGAGFDSRAYRLTDLLKECRVFEVDRPETQALKRRRVAEVLGDVPGNLTYVSIDFRQQKLGDALANAGYQTSQKTFFIWEGVTMYLPEDAVRETLRFVASHAPGSAIVLDYVNSGMIRYLNSIRIEMVPEAAKARVQRLKQLEVGEPWIFGLPDNREKEFLQELGLEAGEVLSVGGEESVRRYLTRADGSIYGPLAGAPRIPYFLTEAVVTS